MILGSSEGEVSLCGVSSVRSVSEVEALETTALSK